MEEKQEKGKRRHLVDVIVISAIVLVAIVILLFVLLFRKTGEYAVVKVNGSVVGEYSLSKDGTYVLNGGTNTLVIEDGRAYIVNSICRTHQCERMGKIRYVGQFIECKHNRLTVTIKSDTEKGVDLVS